MKEADVVPKGRREPTFPPQPPLITVTRQISTAFRSVQRCVLEHYL